MRDDTPRSPRSNLVAANWLPSTQHLNQDGGRRFISQLGREVPGNEIKSQEKLPTISVSERFLVLLRTKFVPACHIVAHHIVLGPVVRSPIKLILG